MRRLPRAVTSVALLVGVCVIAAPSAHAATSVAYLDGKEVWVSSTDGAQKTRLSAGEGDWTAVAQNDNGWIVGVELEAGKIAQLSRFTVWNPQGNVAYRGPLASKPGASSYAFPLGLGITADGRGLAYGFSAYTYAYPVGSLQTGYYFLPSETVVAPALGPLVMSNVEWMTLGPNDRAVGTAGTRQVSVQGTGGLGDTNFDPWFDISSSPSTYEINDLDVSGDGSVFISEVTDNGPAAQDPGRILAIKFKGLGGEYVDDCFLDLDPASVPRHPSVSADGSQITWSDPAGVHVAGAPKFNGPATCELSAAPMVIAPAGTYPSLGGFDVGAYLAARAPAPTPTPAPAPTPTPAPLAVTVSSATGGATKVSSAAASATVKVTSNTSGTAKLTLTILPKALGLKGKKPIVLATGSGTVTAGKASALKLKLTPRGKTLKKRLKGKKALLTITVGATTTTATLKLS